ncbi:MAG: hypothetical protein JW779_00845 [Candidatus Thorarchaeota archaeon]|nr:hypothetical protein [Candidatus Thorarchaeota archaeon]
MELYDLARWLVDNGGPCIRFRTIVDILQEQDVGIVSTALKEMLESKDIKEWVEHLVPQFDINSLHSGRHDAFENVIGKIVQLGLRAGLQPFDNKTLPYRVWLAENVGTYPSTPHAIFLRTIVASFLAYAGYGSTSPVKAQLIKRLETISTFAQEPDFSRIFVDKSEFTGIPKGSESHNIVNPDLYPDQQFMLPWVHDIRGFANCNELLTEQKYQDKINSIIEMILTPEYQKVPWSYGLAKYETGYYVLGWAAHLPGYFSRPEDTKFAELLLTLEFMARFPLARVSPWFIDSMEYIESYRTEEDTYSFPRTWLPEKQTGYWVGGFRMGFDDRRSYPKAIECESTFRVLRIKQIASGK